MSKKLLLDKVNIEGIKTFDVYRREGGYKSVEKALKMQPGEIVEEVKKSGLRGRGGAGFPTGMKWSFLAKPEGVARYLVCNADESEPGTFKDRYLMEFIPHLLIEGMIVSSFALGSNVSYIYIRGEYDWVTDILEKAIDEARQNGFLGAKIFWVQDLIVKYIFTVVQEHISAAKKLHCSKVLRAKEGCQELNLLFPQLKEFGDAPQL